MPLIDNSKVSEDTPAYRKAKQYFAGQVDYNYIPKGIISQMAVPEIGGAALNLMAAIMNEKSLVPAELKMLIAYMTSYAAGCTYCQTATLKSAKDGAASAEKFDKIWEYKTSELFTEAECAALDIALASRAIPSEVTDELRDNLKKHYSQAECAEILGMISLFAYFQTWNDTNGTRIDEQIIGIVENHLSGTAYLNEEKFKQLNSL